MIFDHCSPTERTYVPLIGSMCMWMDQTFVPWQESPALGRESSLLTNFGFPGRVCLAGFDHGTLPKDLIVIERDLTGGKPALLSDPATRVQ